MSSDDELIEAMLVAMYDDGCPGAVDSMRAVLAVVRAHDRDGERWRWAKANLYKFHQITGGAHSDIRESAIDARVDAAMRAEG